ncbi:MAG: hypothetical protein FJY73_04350 [Candidatus Eisenbacteria bacterium]|nr:hypothetical protein [Candidatus Eisenbacteria bacterium]
MKRRYLIVPLIVLLFPIALFLATGREMNPVRATPTEMHLDLEVGGELLQGIPGDCATWHELYPNYCIPHHQDAYQDNGDGVVSVCDYIILDGIRYHIIWVGPTYFTDDGHVWEPVGDPSGSPICQDWHMVYPVYCHVAHVDDWDDNYDGVLGDCDHVLIDGSWVHIDRVGLDIIVVPEPTGTEESTWGQVKKLFRDLF